MRTTIAWIALVIVIVALMTRIEAHPKHRASYIPSDVECWQTEGREFDEKYSTFTPAHILERDALTFMVVHAEFTQECGGIVNGKYVTWPAKQKWVDRGTPTSDGIRGHP